MRTIVALMMGSILLLTGCNTVKGVGQDLQKAGEKIENAAKK
jgi:predicted small secreted protein